MRTVTLLTDFGWTDYYVAAVKGTILRLAGAVQIVDIAHDIAPGDVEAAAFLLGGAAPAFPEDTIHLAVVDPGVGSSRRLLAARTSRGYVVGPDNGVATPLLAGASVWSVERDDLYLRQPGETFHGRDRLAPVAAYLARGEDPGELGPVMREPVRLELPPPLRLDGDIRGRVAHVDRFGNLITNIPTGWLPTLPEVQLGDLTIRRTATHYAELPAGEAGALPGSLGTVELVLANESLARRIGARRGDPVKVRSGGSQDR